MLKGAVCARSGRNHLQVARESGAACFWGASSAWLSRVARFELQSSETASNISFDIHQATSTVKKRRASPNKKSGIILFCARTAHARTTTVTHTHTHHGVNIGGSRRRSILSPLRASSGGEHQPGAYVFLYLALVHHRCFLFKRKKRKKRKKENQNPQPSNSLLSHRSHHHIPGLPPPSPHSPPLPSKPPSPKNRLTKERRRL